MKKIKLIIPLLLISLIFIFVRCEKKDLLNLNEYPINNDVKATFLIFTDFNQLYKALNDTSFDPKSIQPDFVSMSDLIDFIDTLKDERLREKLLKKYSNFLTLDPDGNVESKINDENLLKLLSPEGLIAIKDKIIYIDGEKTSYTDIKNFDYNKLKNQNVSTDRIKVFKTNDTKQSDTKYFYDKKRRHKVKLKKFYRNYGLWSNLGASATHYTKKPNGKFVKSKETMYLTVQWDSCYYELYWPNGFIEKVRLSNGSKNKRKYTKFLHISRLTWWYVGTNPPTVHSYKVYGLKTRIRTYSGISGGF